MDTNALTSLRPSHKTGENNLFASARAIKGRKYVYRIEHESR